MENGEIIFLSLSNPQPRSRHWRNSRTSSSCWNKERSGKWNWRSGKMHGQCIRPSALSCGRLCVDSTRRGETSWTAIIGTWSTRWVSERRSGGRKCTETDTAPDHFAGLWNDWITGQADHVAAVRRLEALPAISSDEERWRGRWSYCQCAGLRVSAYHVQSHALSHHVYSLALYVWWVQLIDGGHSFNWLKYGLGIGEGDQLDQINLDWIF